ncbi:RNA polymerase factor sigma-54 [candidate division WOR-3 bacterium]|uniref:RNA polymerase factor sigma-54 n=1 Tax=candidate division WOR-3 bacterium TaxID=2052148 RepID=A0A9D5K9U9_UNCW3|nr:RNA polymerase factor sigma-54 [candidate division WOR-3 bacterium]MBD3364809.1 RNA polymerase factor sigma-54 [candidate division WOR-3 bacterium]
MRSSSFSSQRLDTRLRQDLSLRLTPEMRLRLDILQANMLLLEEMLELELQQNPALDVIGEEPEAEAGEKTSDEFSVDEFYPNVPQADYSRKDEQEDYNCSVTSDRSILEERMLRKITAEFNSSPLDYSIARYILDCLDEDGFLYEDSSRIAAALGTTEERVERVRNHIQYTEPVGIASHDVREALIIQLRFQGFNEESVEMRILTDAFDLFLQRRITTICNRLRLSTKKVSEAFEVIAKLDPKPARNFREISSRCVQPDIIIHYRNGKLEVLVNEGPLPPLKLSGKVREILSNPMAFRPSDVEFAKRKFEAARMFIKSILQRRDTLNRLGRELLLRNYDFFSARSRRITPLTMKEMASKLELHPSTISRAVRDKYLDSPVGIFHLRTFFTKGDQNPIYGKLKGLIEAEDKENPLTDSEIADILAESGKKISRRTVAKYRMKLNIPDCFQRKALG